MTDLRACVMGRHDVAYPLTLTSGPGTPYCVRCGNVFPMGVPAPFSKDGLTSNTYAPRPGVLGDAT